MVREWPTVKERPELPGFPGNAPAVCLRLNIYNEGKEGVKRKCAKPKVEELHISAFPLYVRSYLNENERTVVPERNIVQEAEPKKIWDMMFRLLTSQQREQVIGRFGAKGIDAVLSFSFVEKSPL